MEYAVELTKFETAATLDIMDMMSDFEDFQKMSKISGQKDFKIEIEITLQELIWNQNQNRDFDLKSWFKITWF